MVVEKVFLLCHFGGQFIGNTNGGNTSYEGGDTRAVMIPRDISFSELQSKLATISSLRAGSFSIKYQAIGASCFVSIYEDNDVETMLCLLSKSPCISVYIFRTHIGDTANTNSVEQNVGYEDGGVTGDIENPLLLAPAVSSILDLENAQRLTRGMSSNQDFENPERVTQGSSSVEDLETPQRVAQRVSRTRKRSAKGLSSVGERIQDSESTERMRKGLSTVEDLETPQSVLQGVSRTRKRSTRGVSSVGDLETPQRVTQGVSSDGDFETPLTVLPSTLVIGAEFQDAHSFRKTLVSFAIAENFALKFINNEASRVTAKCRAEGCTFRIYASLVSGINLFRIRTMNPLHTCDRLLNESHPQIQSEWIADKIKQHVKDNPRYKPKEIMKDIHRNYGVQIGYSQARRGKELAMKILHGSYDDAYHILPSYCQKLIDKNPGTIANIEVDKEDKSFKRLFVAFHATISGFLQGCRPLMALDEMLIKTKYCGYLLAAIAMDAEGVMFPVAFGISVADDAESWEWFLTQLREALVGPQRNRLTFISDLQKGLQPILETVFPNDFHGFCAQSLAESFNNDLKNCELTKYFWKVARAKTLLEFNSRMAEVRAVSSRAAVWIEGILVKFWAAPYIEGMRYNHLTSKLLESFNNWIGESRHLPVVKFLESLRMKLMEHIQKRRELGSQWTSKIVPSADEKIKRRMAKADCFRIFRSNGTQFEVLSDQVDVVNLECRECTCRRWQLSGLPCSHALVAINSKQETISDYCSHYFHVETYRNTFMETIHPVPDRTPMPEVQDFEVNPPRIRRPSGRPKKRGIKTGNNEVRPIHCRKCGGLGHNRQGCKQSD
ncbi:hypothetical protein AMTR_s00024p00070750 [Amborella trichopoda]|uniref:SWIM-type domain-containing protein n=2 Tax=Amborella trichopoda TaxID=13333 RepID=W1PUP6_AMBTC|nr:hypothetical protein AMTR_s00024p00070750 [Amborella trichopoda]